jgi:thymidylate synthase (FAD)
MDTGRLVVPEAEEIIDSYFPVLDYGFVALKDYMGGDTSVEESARVSYGEGTRKISDTRTLLRYLFRNRHTSPFEMVEIRLHIGLPIFVMRQLVRHRTANLNEYSGRYSVMPMLFYTPQRDQVCSQSKKNKQGRGEIIDENSYGTFWRKLQTARGMVANNYGEWVNEVDIARETARLNLPLSTYTYCYWKCDLRNLFNVMALRSDPHAQWEIQQFSDVICGVVKRLCPISFDAFQDYQQTAVTFSQLELACIEMYYCSGVSCRPKVVDYLMEHGCTKREVEDFWGKLKMKNKRDFSLDLTRAKPSDYFRKLVENAVVEAPHDKT